MRLLYLSLTNNAGFLPQEGQIAMIKSLTWPYEQVTNNLEHLDEPEQVSGFSRLDFLEAVEEGLQPSGDLASTLVNWATLVTEFCQPAYLQLNLELSEASPVLEVKGETPLSFTAKLLSYQGHFRANRDRFLEISLKLIMLPHSLKLVEEFSLPLSKGSALRLSWPYEQNEEVRRTIKLAVRWLNCWLERRGVEQELQTLRQTEALQLALLDQAEHDLHGPFGSLAIAADLLLDKGLDLPATELRLILQRLKRNIYTLNTLLEHYLQAPRLISKGQELPPRFQTIDLLPRLQTLVELVGLPLELKKQTLQFKLPPEMKTAWIKADGHYLDQILLNLVCNAHKHTPEGTRIRLEIEQVDGFIKISVVDNGPQLTACLLSGLETLFNGDLPQNELPGMGLKLVYELTRRQHGLAGVTTGPGTTAFWVKLPIAD